jgi:FixJ family two-component response regulator
MTHDTPGVIAAVDDDQTVLKSLQTLLESADYAVRIFASGPALLESGCIAKIDCLISDIGMPGMDGFELSRIVRAARPGLPVILITGRAEMLKPSRAIGRGEHPVFEKPFDGEKLLAAVARAVRTRRSAKRQS